MVEPLGHYFKGHQQPGRNSLSGAFTSTLDTCWKRQNEIYEKFMPTFNEELQAEQTNYGSYDNYNQVLNKKNPTEGKNAITHIGTVYYAKKAKPIDLPVGTVLQSPHGVLFEVVSCKQETPYRFMVCGTLLSHLDSVVEKEVADKNLILTGVLWPEVGWEIQSMPGFTERPPVTYDKQRSQPPRRAWVEERASDMAILFSRKRKFCEPGASNAVSFTTNRMWNVSIKSRRIIDMRSHVLYLKLKKAEAIAEAAPLVNDSSSNNSLPSQVQNDDRMDSFIHTIEAASSAVDCAAQFNSDIIKLVNPSSQHVDEMFAWPIAPFEETSHKGMKMTFTQLMQSFCMVHVDERGTVTSLPNAKRRRIHFFGDGLSARNFSCLKYNISRQLATLSDILGVKALLSALDCCTMQMDYLHENGFHKQDCIWKTKYGCFLQPFQVHLSWLRINGDPSKRNMQGHELFLSIIYRALRTHRLNCFIESCCEEELGSDSNMSAEENLIRCEELYAAYCDQLESCADEPSRLCAIFLKEVESYFRCVGGTKDGNVWLMEKENSDWLSAYKFCGKSNYVPESMRRVELMNGMKLSDWEIEEIRWNRLIKLTEQGNDVSYDELCELLNLWNKSSVSSTNFETQCEKSKHVMASRKCSYETFGMRSQSSKKGASQKSATDTMIELFESASIFQVFEGGRGRWFLISFGTMYGDPRRSDQKRTRI